MIDIFPSSLPANNMKNITIKFFNFSGTQHGHFSALSAGFVLFIITLVMFGDVLFFNPDQVLSKAGLDLFNGEMSGYDFLFRQLKQGSLALWNAYVFCGTPILSTVLYPPLFSFLFLPLPLAVNVGIALHVFLLGLFMYLWTSFRGLHPLACLASAVMIMFCGPYFMHVYAGHLGNICAMTWVPLILLSLDATLDRPSIAWVLMGIFAVSMQILTGQFQYVYYTAITCALYAGIRLWRSNNKGRSIAGMMFIVLGSIGLCSFQILNSWATTQESVRTAGVSFQFSSMFSFPPENLLTFLTPFFFGGMTAIPYWGRCYLWEMSAFIGITGFFMAVYGVLYGREINRWLFALMVILLCILALGVHTPVFQFLYNWLPGFNKFRGSSKFIFPACLFLTMLAGIGFDKLIRDNNPDYKFVIGVAVIGISLFAAAYLIFANPHLMGNIMRMLQATKESYLPRAIYADINFVQYVKTVSASSLFISGFVCLILAALLYLARLSDKIIYIIIAIALIEVFSFARLNRPTFNINETLIRNFTKFYAQHQGDYRVLNLLNPNMAMSTGRGDIWGYGPIAQSRYIQFMAYTQGENPDNADTYVQIKNYHRLFNMLRLRYIITKAQTGFSLLEVDDFMPRLNIIPNWIVLPARDAIFREMDKKSFDPRTQVILEKDPDIVPAISAIKGASKIIESSADPLLIKVNVPYPAMLLITDNYSLGWHALAQSGSIQKDYQIMPANYTLLAIPLQAGEHHLRLEYRPAAFLIGRWISSAALFIYIIVILFNYRTGLSGLIFSSCSAIRRLFRASR